MPIERKLPITVTGKIKSAVARAVFAPGRGRILVNSTPIEIWGQGLLREKVKEPMTLLPDLFQGVDVHVSVEGGGPASQARAAMVVLARGISRWTRSGTARRILRTYDKTMLAGDPRYKEAKKFGGPGARRRFQKSYR